MSERKHILEITDRMSSLKADELLKFEAYMHMAVEGPSGPVALDDHDLRMISKISFMKAVASYSAEIILDLKSNQIEEAVLEELKMLAVLIKARIEAIKNKTKNLAEDELNKIMNKIEEESNGKPSH